MLPRLLAISLLCVIAGAAFAEDGAARLLAKHAELQGPLGTRDYRIAFEAAPLDAGRTFIHLDYSYAYGVAGRLAMGAYLGTTGRGKKQPAMFKMQVQDDPRSCHDVARPDARPPAKRNR